MQINEDHIQGEHTVEHGARVVRVRLRPQIEQGFRGVEVDPTPNENYTVAGVTAGKPTPETDTAAAKAARKVTGLGISGIEAAERDRNASGNKGAK